MVSYCIIRIDFSRLDVLGAWRVLSIAERKGCEETCFSRESKYNSGWQAVLPQERRHPWEELEAYLGRELSKGCSVLCRAPAPSPYSSLSITGLSGGNFWLFGLVSQN